MVLLILIRMTGFVTLNDPLVSGLWPDVSWWVIRGTCWSLLFKVSVARSSKCGNFLLYIYS